MLKVIQEAMFVHVFYYFGGHDVFQDLAEDASKGYWTVVYSLRFATLFEHCSPADTQLDLEVGFKLFFFTDSCWLDFAIKESG